MRNTRRHKDTRVSTISDMFSKQSFFIPVKENVRFYTHTCNGCILSCVYSTFST